MNYKINTKRWGDVVITPYLTPKNSLVKFSSGSVITIEKLETSIPNAMEDEDFINITLIEIVYQYKIAFGYVIALDEIPMRTMLVIKSSASLVDENNEDVFLDFATNMLKSYASERFMTVNLLHDFRAKYAKRFKTQPDNICLIVDEILKDTSAFKQNAEKIKEFLI